jgi:hypothetical protein
MDPSTVYYYSTIIRFAGLALPSFAPQKMRYGGIDAVPSGLTMWTAGSDLLLVQLEG